MNKVKYIDNKIVGLLKIDITYKFFFKKSNI